MRKLSLILLAFVLVFGLAVIGCGGGSSGSGEEEGDGDECTTHTWGSWAEKTPPTLTEDGVEERECSVCGHKQEKSIPKLLQHTIFHWKSGEHDGLLSGGLAVEADQVLTVDGLTLKGDPDAIYPTILIRGQTGVLNWLYDDQLLWINENQRIIFGLTGSTTSTVTAGVPFIGNLDFSEITAAGRDIKISFAYQVTRESVLNTDMYINVGTNNRPNNTSLGSGVSGPGYVFNYKAGPFEVDDTGTHTLQFAPNVNPNWLIDPKHPNWDGTPDRSGTLFTIGSIASNNDGGVRFKISELKIEYVDVP